MKDLLIGMVELSQVMYSAKWKMMENSVASTQTSTTSLQRQKKKR